MSQQRQRTNDVLGKIGQDKPVAELSKVVWDAIVVGAGHNGLACATYLARAGKRVLVLEARERVGGACTLEETWPGFRISPCAYVAGLIHPLVMKELNFDAYGFEWMAAEGGLFVPFEDGSCIQLWDDEERCEKEIARMSPRDVAGWRGLHDLFDRTCEALRPNDERDMWLGKAPTREMIEQRLGGDKDAIDLVFNMTMNDLMEKFFHDERLQLALMGQGIVGTNASPFDPGTASIYLHHYCGRMDGKNFGAWGYVKGGMGMVSFILNDIARDTGVTICAATPVAKIVPELGVELVSGEVIRAPVVVSNADPKATARLLGNSCDKSWLKRVESIPMQGCTVKLNAALKHLPDFKARPGTNEPHHLATINTPLKKNEWRQSYSSARAGELPPRLWTEIYLQTAYDRSVAPEGQHVMSVFAQYVPYSFNSGTWDTKRDEAGRIGIESISRFCNNFDDSVIAMDVLGPPDIEERVGLTGGHIFQGECLPQYMWSNRLEPKTPMPGVYLCGACTHPGGSVIGVNGRNAAMEILHARKPAMAAQ